MFFLVSISSFDVIGIMVSERDHLTTDTQYEELTSDESWFTGVFPPCLHLIVVLDLAHVLFFRYFAQRHVSAQIIFSLHTRASSHHVHRSGALH